MSIKTPTTEEETHPMDVIQMMSALDAKEQENHWLNQIRQSPTRFNLTSMLVLGWIVLGLAVTPMLRLFLPDVADRLFYAEPRSWITYSLQLPLALTACAVLGRKFALLAMVLYLGLGFAGLPWFANGGGPDYIHQESVGYLLGLLAVPFVLEPWLTRMFYNNRSWIKRYVLLAPLAAFIALGTVHLFGLTGLLLHTLLASGWLDWPTFNQWAYPLTVRPFLYDWAFTFAGLLLVRPLRMLLWLGLY